MGLAIFGVRLGQACAWLTHAWVKFSRMAQWRFLTVPSVCRGPNCPLPPPGGAEKWVRLSQRTFSPTFKGSNRTVWGWSDSPTPVGSDCHKMKTFVGRIITVSDGAGQSVTVSKQGVA